MQWIDVEKAQPITIDGTMFHVKPCSWPEKIDLAQLVGKFPVEQTKKETAIVEGKEVPILSLEDEKEDNLEQMKSEDYNNVLIFIASKIQSIEGYEQKPYKVLLGMQPVDIMKLTTGLFDISGIGEAEEKK